MKATKTIRIDPLAHKALMERAGKRPPTAVIRELLGLPAYTVKRGCKVGWKNAKKK